MTNRERIISKPGLLAVVIGRDIVHELLVGKVGSWWCENKCPLREKCLNDNDMDCEVNNSIDYEFEVWLDSEYDESMFNNQLLQTVFNEES